MGHNGRAEMTTGSDIRDPAAMREELADLSEYLNGLPDEIRRTGAFTAYDQRAGELSRELVLADILLTLNLPGKFPNEPPGTNDYGRMHDYLSVLTRRHEHIAERSLRVSRAVQWVVLAAWATAAGSMLVNPITAEALAKLVSMATSFAGIAALADISLAKRARKQEKTAMHLSNLFEEISHSFGPAGQVLRPSEYYSASTKRIESLLDEIKATVGPEGAAPKR
jgi:hypothetical protein